MGKRYTKLYMESVLEGKPRFWIAPPANIFAADLGDTFANGVLVGASACVISIGTFYLATHRIDLASSISWGLIAGGLTTGLPITGEVLAEFMGDIAQAVAEGWNRGQPEPEPEPAPLPEPTEDEVGAARVPGAWWYHDARGLLKCYHTPVGQARGTEPPKPIISDARMQAIFARIANGVPFSERRLCDKNCADHIPGLSGTQFRKLQDDWCHPTRKLYELRKDRSGYFTPAGKRIAEAIRTAEL